MKTIKFLLVSLFVMLGTTAFSQDVVVTMTNGTTETIENADSVVYDVKVYGYYSFNATSKIEIASLTEADFTKLTQASTELSTTIKDKGLPVVLTTGNVPPTLKLFSVAAGNDWGNEGELRPGNTATGTTITINNTIYNIWYSSGQLSKIDNTKLIINIK